MSDQKNNTEKPENLDAFVEFVAEEHGLEEDKVRLIFNQSYDAPQESLNRLNSAMQKLISYQANVENIQDPILQAARYKAIELLNSENVRSITRPHNLVLGLGGSLTYGKPEKWDLDLTLIWPENSDYDEELSEQIEAKIISQLNSQWLEFLKEKNLLGDELRIRVVEIMPVHPANLEKQLKETLNNPNELIKIGFIMGAFDVFASVNAFNYADFDEYKKSVTSLSETNPIFRAIIITAIERYLAKIESRFSGET